MTEKTETVTTTEIKEYTKTEKGLAKLRSELADVIFDCGTKKGMTDARKSRMKLVKTRTTLESIRKEIKAPALERCRLIDAEAKRLLSEILALEEPIAAQIKIEDDRVAAEEAKAANEARIAAEAAAAEAQVWQTRIEAIKRRPLDFIGVESIVIKTAIDKAKLVDVDGWPEDLRDAAGDALAGAIKQMETMHTTAVQAEEMSAKVKELEASKPAPATEQNESGDPSTTGDTPPTPVVNQVRSLNKSPRQDAPVAEESAAGFDGEGEYLPANHKPEFDAPWHYKSDEAPPLLIMAWMNLVDAAIEVNAHFGKFSKPHETIVALDKAIDAVKSV